MRLHDKLFTPWTFFILSTAFLSESLSFVSLSSENRQNWGGYGGRVPFFRWLKVLRLLDRLLTGLGNCLLCPRLLSTPSLHLQWKWLQGDDVTGVNMMIQRGLSAGYLCIRHVDVAPAALDTFDLPFQCQSG